MNLKLTYEIYLLWFPLEGWAVVYICFLLSTCFVKTFLWAKELPGTVVIEVVKSFFIFFSWVTLFCLKLLCMQIYWITFQHYFLKLRIIAFISFPITFQRCWAHYHYNEVWMQIYYFVYNVTELILRPSYLYPLIFQ